MTNAHDVYLDGKLIDTVFDQESDPTEVKRSLVNHDGYDSRIVVVAECKHAGQCRHVGSHNSEAEENNG